MPARRFNPTADAGHCRPSEDRLPLKPRPGTGSPGFALVAAAVVRAWTHPPATVCVTDVTEIIASDEPQAQHSLITPSSAVNSADADDVLPRGFDAKCQVEEVARTLGRVLGGRVGARGRGRQSFAAVRRRRRYRQREAVPVLVAHTLSSVAIFVKKSLVCRLAFSLPRHTRTDELVCKTL